MPKIINRYIFKEVAIPFAMILFVLTFILLMGKLLQIMDLLVNKGISMLAIIKIIVLLMPSFMMFTIPIALLIAILVGMGRLSADNEITALKASGIGLRQIFHPLAAAALITFIITIIISNFLVPQSNMATKQLLFSIAQQNASVGIKEKVFNADFNGILLYAEKIPVDGNHMESVIVSDSRIAGEQNTIVAQKAYLISNPESLKIMLRLENGSNHIVSGDLKSYRKIDFKSYDINLDLAAAMNEANKEEAKSSTEMTLNELLAKMKKPGLEEAAVRELAIEAHKKFSIPLSCIFFGILAFPLGIRSHRAVKSRGFAVGLIVVSVYYLLRIGGEALVETGRLSPVVGAWTPNLLFALLGIYLFIMADREKSLWLSLKIFLRRRFLKN